MLAQATVNSAGTAAASSPASVAAVPGSAAPVPPAAQLAVHALALPLLAVVVFFSFRRFRARATEWILSKNFALGFLKAGDKTTAVVSGVLITMSFRHDWSNHPVRGIYLAMGAVGFFVCSLMFLWLSERAGDKKSAQISRLETELEGSKMAFQNQARRLNLAHQTAALCNQLVERKTELLKTGKSDGSNGVPWNPRMQARTIIQLIHKAVSRWLNEQHPQAVLRLGVYLPRDMQELDLCLSWNGHTEECYRRHPDRMRLCHPSGSYSVVVRTWHAEGNTVLTLIPKTLEAPGFEFWSAEQKEHLLSIATYKYKIVFDGTQSAMILEMDTNASGFFDEDLREPLSTLLNEMLRRFEYEMLCASLISPNRQTDKKEVT